MKKVLAIFLCALLICISVAPIGSAVNGPQLSLKVAEGEYSSNATEAVTVTETTFTVTVAAPKATEKLVGANLYFEYDPAVLTVVGAGLAGAKDKANFNGLFVSGLKSGSNNQYALAWISDKGVTKAQANDFMYVTFNVIDTSKVQTSLNLYIDEYRTNDGNAENDITSTRLYENKIINLSFPDGTPPATTAPTTDGDESTDKINELLDVIRDMLNGNGVTFADFADAIANALGNAEITDIVEQLVDGNVDVSNGFLGILKSLGFDFDSFEDILNKIIDFIMGLFGGSKGEQTTAAAGNPATTAPGSSSGSEATGDVGIALAATVCVLSSAAFVITRKKKEII